MSKWLGPGVSYNPTTKLYSARLGVKEIGQYKTLESAAEHYNEQARRIFTFPILNKNHVEPEPEPIRTINTKKTKVEEPVVPTEATGNTDPMLETMLLSILGMSNE